MPAPAQVSCQPLPHPSPGELQCWQCQPLPQLRVAGVAAVPWLCLLVADRNRRGLPWCSEPCELSGLLNNLTLAVLSLPSCLWWGMVEDGHCPSVLLFIASCYPSLLQALCTGVSVCNWCSVSLSLLQGQQKQQEQLWARRDCDPELCSE